MSLGFDGMGAAYFDGDHPVAQEVSLHIANEALQIGLDNGDTVFWPVEKIRKLPDVAGKAGYVLRMTADPVARLLVTDAALRAHLPHISRRSPPKGRGRLAVWAVAAIAAVALQIGLLVPLLADRLAVFIPPEGERALGEATFGQIRQALDDTGLNPLMTCEAPEGVAALTRMLEKLGQGADNAAEISVFVLDHEMVNAFALPGGLIVLFRGLIAAADGPDQVAAVVAHEMGHVVSRDPTRHALRSAGSIGVLGLLFGDFAGGAAVLFLTERLISAQYSQTAETGADQFAYGRLDAANVSPSALADMFMNLRREGGDINGVLAHFLSHPSLDKRIVAARDAAVEGADYAPILSDAEWADLRVICR